MINNHLHSRAEVNNERSCISPPHTYLHNPERDAFTVAVLSGKKGYCMPCGSNSSAWGRAQII
jgi:hypothetical protein